MRKINKSPGPNELTVYAALNQNDTWNAFKQNHGDDSKIIKKKIFDEQGNICAYCETNLSIPKVSESHRRVEHFNSKSGWVIGQAQPNWHLEWDNVIGVCLGGTDKDNINKFEMPANTSCDVYKEYLEREHGCSKRWLGNVVSPLEAELDSRMFDVSRASGEISINDVYANTANFEHNNYETSAELLERSLEVFNLNCDRLKTARRVVQFKYTKILQQFKQSNDRDRFKFLLVKWSGQHGVNSFQTTRDCLIRNCKVAQKIL